jgi:hypothetical protein
VCCLFLVQALFVRFLVFELLGFVGELCMVWWWGEGEGGRVRWEGERKEREGGWEERRLVLRTPSSDDSTEVATKRMVVMAVLGVLVRVWPGGGSKGAVCRLWKACLCERGWEERDA